MNVEQLQVCVRGKPFDIIFKPFFAVLQSSSHFRLFSSQKSTESTKTKGLVKGLRVLDVIASKPSVIDNRQSHLRLIQDFLQTSSYQFSEQRVSDYYPYSNSMEDSILMLFRLHREGLKTDASVLSHALSSCGSSRTLSVGIQIHCMSIVNGFMGNVYIGSSLITFYSKCCALDNACRVFDEMSMRNIVSWTAIMNGFAQECQVDICLGLYHKMRISRLSPNDFTFTSFLSACTGSGCLGKGKSVHCQTIQMGFDSYIHIANALMSMYCKCGTVKDALFVLENMNYKDLVSWNTMIAGYAQHGLASQAIGLFEELMMHRVKPDAITFLGILSSCRHAGFVEQGWFYFNSMVKYGINPEMDHYSCIVDLLGRAGLIEEARDFIKKMPTNPNAIIWGSLLSSCRLHGNVLIGIEAAENRLVLEPWSAATHLQLANMYASTRCWDQAARIRKLMKDRGMKTEPGYSWIEIKNVVSRFRVEDKSNNEVSEVLAVLDVLVDHMSGIHCVPGMHEEEADYYLYTAI
ncbi:unnamed protein product [Ilex paraguariensis]|uniref:Pentatricopeptide repeat-containing protein n=1 Tax=Ilex paraguariensis TaxID=185542 RepID=A0ABC8TJZ4_9AQUA